MIKDKKIIIVLSLVVIILAVILIGACGCGCVCTGHITNDEENGAVLRINNYRGNSLLDKDMVRDRAY